MTAQKLSLRTLADIELAIDRSVQPEGRGMTIPKAAVNRRSGALHDASRLQLLVTWARRHPDAPLSFHRSNSAESVIAALNDYAPGYAALRLADRIAVGDETLSSARSRDSAYRRLEHQDNLELSKFIKGRCLDLTCVSGAPTQFLRPLFERREARAVRSIGGMHNLFKVLLDYVAKEEARHIPSDFVKTASVFAHELFSNTQQHALRDWRGAPYTKHVEGLIFSWNNLYPEEFAADFAGHPKLSDFWERSLTAFDSGPRSLRCFQVSFFDSGPGLASRMLTSDSALFPIAAEREALVRCFSQHASHKRSPGAGGGLPDVLRALESVGGLLRVRSARQSVFTVAQQGAPPDPIFHDWTDRPLSFASGSVVSLIIPVRHSA